MKTCAIRIKVRISPIKWFNTDCPFLPCQAEQQLVRDTFRSSIYKMFSYFSLTRASSFGACILFFGLILAKQVLVKQSIFSCNYISTPCQRCLFRLALEFFMTSWRRCIRKRTVDMNREKDEQVLLREDRARLLIGMSDTTELTSIG